MCPNVDPMPQMTSFVQVRGSIPFFWYQEPDPLIPKPRIVLDRERDVPAHATRRHFARLFRKYSSPIYSLNLTKADNKREETVASEYRNFVNVVLNKELPPAFRVNFIHYDVKKAKKTEGKLFPK